MNTPLPSSQTGSAVTWVSVVAALCLSGCQLLGREHDAGGSRFAARGQQPQRSSATRLRSQPGAALELVGTALDHYKQGRLQAARTAIRSALKADPFSTSAYELEARIALDVGDEDGYRIALQRTLDIHPRAARVQNSVGKRLVQKGHTAVGLKALKKAVALSPRHAGYARDLAAAYLEQDDTEAAQEVLTQAESWNPQDGTMPVVLARFYESTENWQPAAHYYAVALSNDPTNLSWRRHQARCLYRLGEYSRACDIYSACIESDASAISLAEYAEYGDACLRQGDVARAQMVFDRISRYSPVRSKEVELLRAICAIRRNDMIRARSILRTASILWPKDRDLAELQAVAADADDRYRLAAQASE